MTPSANDPVARELSDHFGRPGEHRAGAKLADAVSASGTPKTWQVVWKGNELEMTVDRSATAKANRCHIERVCPACGKRLWFEQREVLDADDGDQVVTAGNECGACDYTEREVTTRARERAGRDDLDRDARRGK